VTNVTPLRGTVGFWSDSKSWITRLKNIQLLQRTAIELLGWLDWLLAQRLAEWSRAWGLLGAALRGLLVAWGCWCSASRLGIAARGLLMQRFAAGLAA